VAFHFALFNLLEEVWTLHVSFHIVGQVVRVLVGFDVFEARFNDISFDFLLAFGTEQMPDQELLSVRSESFFSPTNMWPTSALPIP